ncbi:MAG TPA: AsmA family protein [Tepidisphaeraceae bacterium]|jgi:hypothetical protein
MKIIKWVVLGLVLLVVAVVVIVYLNLNRIVKRTVETQGTQQLNVATTLDGAALSLFGGSLKLDDLEIASPPGFSAPKILSLDDAKVRVSYGQLKQDPVHVQLVDLKGPKLVIEQSGGKFNFNALMDNSAKTEDKPAGDPNRPMHVIIDQLNITDAMVVIRPGIPGLAQEINVPLPAVSMQKVGTGEGNQNGAALKDVVMDVITTMAAKAADSDKIPPELKALLSGNLREMAGKLVNEQVKKLTAEVQSKLPPEAGKALEGVLKDPKAATTNPGAAIQQGLGGLLGGQKDQPKTEAKKTKKPATRPAP